MWNSIYHVKIFQNWTVKSTDHAVYMIHILHVNNTLLCYYYLHMYHVTLFISVCTNGGVHVFTHTTHSSTCLLLINQLGMCSTSSIT